MPVVKHGLAFKYFDKAICGVVALALLAGIVLALSRAASAKDDASPGRVQPILVGLENEMGKRHVDPEPEQYAEQFRKHLRDVRTPRAVPGSFYMPLPVPYAGLTISTNREFVLGFNAPLTRDSITVSGSAPLVDVLEHPVDGDYKRVRLSSGAAEGRVIVEGLSSDGVRHTYPVRVDASAGKTAYPPQKLKVVSTQKGAVVLNVVPEPRNAEEGVDVAQYEIWRRDWKDPLGAFRKVADVKAEDIPSATATTATYNPRLAGTPYGAAAQAAAQESIFWEDRGVTPGFRYGYKVRMVGTNTYPAASEFTESQLAEVDPDVDFRFSRSVGEKVGCEVLKAAGAVPAETFYVVAGDEIGGVVKNQLGAVASYLTGNVVLDFQPSILLGRSKTTDRMIYADPEGFLRQRLRREAKAGKAQWDAAATARRGGASAVGMPGGYAPAGLRR